VFWRGFAPEHHIPVGFRVGFLVAWMCHVSALMLRRNLCPGRGSHSLPGGVCKIHTQWTHKPCFNAGVKRTIFSRHRSAAVFAVAALALTACGGSDSSDSAADAPAEESDSSDWTCPWAAGEVDIAGFLAEPCYADPYSGDMYRLDPGYITVLPAALAATGLDADLADANPITLFAPTDAAMTTLLEAVDMTADELLAETEILTAILTQHVVEGDVSAMSALSSDVELTAVNGESVTMFLGETGTALRFCDDQVADLVHLDIDVSNGTVHIIDTVLLPADGCL